MNGQGFFPFFVRDALSKELSGPGGYILEFFWQPQSTSKSSTPHLPAAEKVHSEGMNASPMFVNIDEIARSPATQPFEPGVKLEEPLSNIFQQSKARVRDLET